jgi:hypothetical protein
MFIIETYGCAVALLVETLRYKPEGRGFDSGWGYWDVILPAGRNDYKEYLLVVKAARA